ncbi:MAG TPA: hypothetical protein VFQ35_09440 [Polyangiaceae bacterium]|nr:hypothetical protein [Polyangiaceae bacterium]
MSSSGCARAAIEGAGTVCRARRRSDAILFDGRVLLTADDHARGGSNLIAKLDIAIGWPSSRRKK